MDLTPAEQLILDRFAEKCRIAGGPRSGYVLRERAIRYHEDRHPGVDFGAGLASLVDRELLRVSESGEFYFLSDAGVEALETTGGGGA